jgi:hypothetical protein
MGYKTEPAALLLLLLLLLLPAAAGRSREQSVRFVRCAMCDLRAA